MSDKCISCHEPLSYPSGDGCANMTAHAKEPPMSNTSKSIEVQVVNITENEDGSATYTFDLSRDLSELCGSFGLKLLMYCGALGKSPEYAFDLLGKQLEDKLAEAKEEDDKDHEPT